METMTSQEALTGIFTLLSAVVDLQDNKEKSVRTTSDTDNAIISLLLGMVETGGAEQIGIAGELLEKLSKGVIEIDKVGKETFENVSSSINVLNKAIGLFKLDPKFNSNIDLIVEAFSKFDLLTNHIGSLTAFIDAILLKKPDEALKNVTVISVIFKSFNSLMDVDVDKLVKSLTSLSANKKVAKSIGEFISALTSNIKDIEPLSVETAKSIGILLENITGVAKLNMFKLYFTFHPFFAKRVAKSIGIFLETIITELNKSLKVDEDTAKAIGNILSGITSLANVNMKKLFWTFRSGKALLLANIIANFISSIAKKLKDKKVDKSITYITDLLKPIADIGNSKNFKLTNLLKVFNPVIAKLISEFFSTIVNGLPDKDAAEGKIKGCAEVLKALSGIDKTSAKAIVYLSNNVSKEQGENIALFITALCSAEVNEAQIKATTDLVNAFGNIILKIVGSVAVLAILIAILPLSSILLSLVVMATIVIGMEFIIKRIVNNLDNKKVDNASEVINAVGKLMLMMTLSLTILMLTSKFATLSDIGSAILMFTVEIIGVILLVKFLSGKQMDESIKHATDVMYGISVLLVAMSVSMLILTNVAKNNDIKDIGIAIGIVGIFVLLTVGVVYALGKMKKDKLEEATLTLLAVTLCFTIISIVAATLLIPIGKKANVVLPGALVVIGIVGLMVGIVWLISRIDKKDVVLAVSTLWAVTAMFTIISLVSVLILKPLGKDPEPAIIGGLIVLGIIALLALSIRIVGGLDKDKVIWGTVCIAAMALILVITSLVIKEILIPIGEQAKPALYGIGIATLVIAGMVGAIWGLSKIDNDTIIEGAIKLVGIAVVTAILGLCIGPIIDIALKAGEKPGDTFAGLGAIAAILVGVTGAIFVLEKIGLEKIFFGGILLSAISGVVLILGLCMTPIINLAINAGKDAKSTFAGLGAIGTVLGAVGALILILGVMGVNPLIWIAVGIGGALLAAISGTMLLIYGVTSLYMSLTDKLKGYDKKSIKASGETLSAMFDALYDIIDAATPNPLLMIKIGLLPPFLLAMTPILLGIKLVANTISSVLKVVSYEDIIKFRDIVVGKKGDESNSLIGSLDDIVSRISSFGILATVKAALISKALMPIIKTVSFFIDVVKKVATLSYISGYDSNGNPIFTKLPPTVFKDAAEAVSKGFGTFIDTISKSFSEFKWSALLTVKLIGDSLNPIINTLSKFVDVIIKVSTMTYIKEYDSNGKPVFEHVPPTVFGTAALVVSKGFSDFLVVLNTEFKKLNEIGDDTIKSLGKALKPVVETLGKFVDVVIKVSTMTYISGYDKNGNPEFTTVEPAVFTDAALVVSKGFGEFLETLGTNLNNLYSYQTVTALNAIKKSVSPVMDGISKFVDAIVKLASATISESTGELDANGNVIFKTRKLKDEELISAAQTIATKFGVFLKEVTANFTSGWFKTSTETALEAIGDNIGPVMDGVSLFVEAIINLAAGTITTTAMENGKILRDKDGNILMTTRQISDKEYEKAAERLTDSFTTFIKTLTERLAPIRKDAEKAKEAIQDSIVPIMDAVHKFSEAIKPFLALTDNKKDTNPTAENYLCLKPDFIRTISLNIANAFTDFIGIVITYVTSEDMVKKYESAEKTFPKVEKTMKHIESSVKKLKSIIDQLTDKDNKVITTGTEIAHQFFSTLHAFVTGLDPAQYDYNANGEIWNKSITPLLTHIEKSTEIVNKIIGLLKTGENEKSNVQIINELNQIIESMVVKAISVDSRIKTIDFLRMQDMSSAYHHVALEFMTISEYMMRNSDLSGGIDIFITNMDKLTGKEFTGKIIQSGNTIQIYQTHLNKFTLLIQETTQHVKIYVTELDRAREALKALDELIINKEDRRNRALLNFADKVNNIADAINNVKDAFETLNENKILKQFDNIRALLDTINDDLNADINVNVNKNTNVTTTVTGQPNRNVSNRNNSTNQNTLNNSGNTVIQNRPLFSNNIKVEFNLQGWPQLTGHMNIKL